MYRQKLDISNVQTGYFILLTRGYEISVTLSNYSTEPNRSIFLHTQKKMVQTLNLAHIKDELMRAQKRKFDPLNLPKIELLNF